MEDRTIVTEGLVKRYASGVLAVDGVSLHVRTGEVYGLLGPNGAGKSTTVAVLTTLLQPTGGRAAICGFDVVRQAARVRRATGVALQEIGLDPLMKPLELLAIQARLFGASRRDAARRAQDLVELVGLTGALDRRVGQYSGGMRRRLDLAMALAHEPQVLFLDEPTTGLDPVSRREIWAEVQRLNRERGITILLTTQYLEEADSLADRIGIIDQGKLAVEGTPPELKARLGSESINIALPDSDAVERARSHLTEVARKVQVDRLTLRLYLDGAAGAVPAVMARLQQAGLEAVAVTLTQPTLDDVFLAVTGHRIAIDGLQTAAD
ncbi:MAG TPA: ATP-binding cassette domain-containing protein [Symbiobacteriaceae bacterium]|nr:ATP-binding cassette domain-containing protein [Symbiobacteriaceae bacterium]